MFEDTVIIVAHDDDEALMAGGYLSKYSRSKGCMVVSVVFIESPQHEVSIRNSRQYAYRYMNLEEENFKIDLPRAAQKVKEVLLKLRPNTIITHGSFDTHQDHCDVNRIVEIATRAIYRDGRSFYAPVILHGYGVGSYENSDRVPKPNAFVKMDEKEMIFKKMMIDAFSTETSGIRDGFNSEIDARYFGKMADSEYAEAYFVKRFLL